MTSKPAKRAKAARPARSTVEKAFGPPGILGAFDATVLQAPLPENVAFFRAADAYVKEYTSSPEQARAKLQELGIVTKTGRLAKAYK